MPTEAAAATLFEAPALPRDVRVDQIGFVSELQKQHADGLKTKVKIAMLEKEQERVTGDYFEGQLVQGETGSIDATKFYGFVKRGRFNLKQFLACCTVSKTAAAELVSGVELDAITEKKPSTPALRVYRKKGVELQLVDALKGLTVPS